MTLAHGRSCPGCESTTLCAVLRAPLANLRGYKRRRGWSFPWASSFDSDFNYDFQTAITKEEQRSGVVEYNYRSMDVMPMPEAADSPIADIAAALGTDAATYTRELPCYGVVGGCALTDEPLARLGLAGFTEARTLAELREAGARLARAAAPAPDPAPFGSPRRGAAPDGPSHGRSGRGS